MSEMPNDLAPYRELFPITERYTFLSHAAVSPTSRRVTQAVRETTELMEQVSFLNALDQALESYNSLRRRIVSLINARGVDEIALMPNTAAGINAAARSLPLQAGDNVLVLDSDYPANIYPWLNLADRGVLTKFVPTRGGGLDLATLEQRIDRRTRVIALSTVMFSTGFRNNIAAVGQLCHERGIYFVVDGIQSLGALPMDVQACHIDFLASGAHKWLMSAQGGGFLYCRREIMDDLRPGADVGASSVVDPFNYLDYNFTFPPNASRFHTGTQNWLGIVALNAALELLLDVGIERVSQQILTLTAALIDDLAERGYRLVSSIVPEQRSGIVVAQIPDADGLCTRLAEAGLIVTSRGTGLRVAPHFYNTPAEVLRVGELLEAHGVLPDT